MKKFSFFITVLIFLCNFAFSQNYKTSFLEDKNGDYLINIELNHWNVDTIKVNNAELFTKINFLASTTIKQKGWAELPIINTAIQLPSKENFEVKNITPTYVEIQLGLPLLPSRGTIYRNQKPSEIPYQIDPNSLVDEFYPKSNISIASPFIVRDVRGTVISFYPFQYNAVTKILKVCTKIVVRGECNTKSAAINPLLTTKNYINEDENALYKSIFVNYNDAGNSAKSSLGNKTLHHGQYGDILVIYTSRDQSTIQPYIQWKREKGFNVSELLVSTGTNVATNIQNAYNSNPNLMYVQLVGDWPDIKSPTTAAYDEYYSKVNYGSDPYMGCVAGGDNYPDIAIGRFSCNNTTQLQIQIDKTINYEKTPDMTAGWHETFIGIGSDEGNGSGDDGEVDYTHIQRIYSERLQNFTYNQHKQNYAPSATKTALAGYINSGASTIAYCGHGANDQFVTTTYSSTDVDNSTNGNKLPFVMAVACVNGEFYNFKKNTANECFAEHWLRKQNGGAVLYLGSTINQPWTPPQKIQDYFYDILIGGYNYSVGNGYTTSEQRTFWGAIVTNAFVLGYTEDNSSDMLETIKTWTTFGDASLQLRTKQPVTITSSSTSLMIGANFTTTITAGTTPVVNAMVCISQNGNYFSGITDAQGQVSIANTLNTGQALLVVTAFNTTTIYQNININTPNPPVADFYGTPTTIYENETVTFTNTSQYGATFDWTFGDGTISTLQNPVHTYTTAGNYNVSLKATNSKGDNTKTEPNYIKVIVNPNPPVADFTADQTTISIGSTVNFTDLTTNIPTSWSWDFGDSGTATTQNPSHTYNAVGTFTVTLVATNNNGSNTKTRATYITVVANYCTANATNKDEYIGNVTFNTINNTSNGWSTGGYGDFTSMNTTVVKGQTYQISINVPTNYSQDRVYCWIDYNINGVFDNSSATELAFTQNTTGQTQNGNSVNKTYLGNITIPTTATSGTTRMRIRLQYNGNSYNPNTTPCGSSGYGEVEDYSVTIIDPQVPVSADFSANQTTIYVGGTVNFTDLSTGTPTSWSWNFGDSGTATTQNPSHTYNAAGNYTVTLITTNISSSDTETKTNYINVIVNPNAPVTDFSAGQTIICQNETVNFTDLSTKNPISWSWTFGDSGTATTQNPSHTYNTAGTYTVTLIATNNDGSNPKIKTNYITVKPLPTVNFPSEEIQHCVGIEFTHTLSGTFDNILWTDGTNGQTYTNTFSQIGDYNVDVTVSKNGCSASYTMSISIIPQPTAIYNNIIACGDNFTLPSESIWYNPENQQVTTITENGEYTAVISNGVCSINQTINVTLVKDADILVYAKNCSSANSNDGSATIYSTTFLDFIQYFDIKWSNGSTSASIANLSAGTYSVTLTNKTNLNACEIVKIVDISAPSGLNDAETSVISLYPNPNNGRFTIDVSSLGNLTNSNIKYQIYDAKGALISEGNITYDKQEINLNAASGDYSIKIITTNGDFIEKLIVR